MSRSAREYLQHILDETAYLIITSHGLDKDVFIQDETLKRAYVRSVEVIGEAVKQLPDALRQKYTAIDWRAMAGMRDGKIWLQHNSTENDIAEELVEMGVPKTDIVIGFHSPFKRQFTEYAAG